MKDSGKIAVVGDKDAVYAFKTLGIDIFVSENSNQTREIIARLTEEDYCIILVNSKQAEEISGIIVKAKGQPYPIILPIPNGASENKFSQRNIDSNIEKATGKARSVKGEE